MKISTYKEIHNGVQPIRVLKHNLAHRLVDRNPDLIKDLHLHSKLAKHINYNIADFSLEEHQMPYINENGVISIHETFLSYIWIVSFTIFIFYEEGIAIPDQLKRGLKPYKNPNPELLDLAKELFSYGKSLIKSYSAWDKNYLPNPEYYDRNTAEGWYIERVNDIYVEAINFILFHEIAHAEYEHISQSKSKKISADEIKKMEIEADTRAIELIFKSARNKTATEISVLIGLASILFFRHDFKGGPKHPDVDIRIENYISIIKPQKDNAIWGILVVFMKLWDEQFNHNFVYENNYNDFSELYYEMKRQI